MVIYRKSQDNDLESSIKSSEQKIDVIDEEHELSCGKPVNFTFYDTLVGVMNRLINNISAKLNLKCLFFKGAASIYC